MENVGINGVPNGAYTVNLNVDAQSSQIPKANLDIPNDSFESEKPKALKKIGFFRALFQRLTKEQIKAINETKELPKGAKFMCDEYGRPRIAWNAFNITWGTTKLPEGYELKNDILGFTHVVREDTKGLFLKKN